MRKEDECEGRERKIEEMIRVTVYTKIVREKITVKVNER